MAPSISVTVSDGTPAAASASAKCPATKPKWCMVIPQPYAGAPMRQVHQGRGEELHLLALEAVHIRPGEEAGQFIVGKHPNVEVLDHDFDGLVPTDPVVDGCRRGLAEARQNFHKQDWNISALLVS